MAPVKPAVIAASLSLGLAFLLVYFVRPFSPSPPEGYAVLTVSSSYTDSSVVRLLLAAGVEGCVSESTQWVFLDDFGELQRVPLESYRERVEPFDPRDDGYAERLRSFFVYGGERRLFIPLSGVSAEALRSRVGEVLADIPFSLDFLGKRRSLFLSMLIFLGAAVCTVALSGDPWAALAQLPLAAALALAGPAGMALAAVVVGLVRLALDPLREAFVSRRYGPLPLAELLGRLASFKNRLPVLAVFLAAYAFIAVLGNINLPVSISALPASFLVLAVFLWAEPGRDKGQHIRFLPVPLRGAPFSPFFLPKMMIPLALAPILVLAGEALVFPGPVAEGWAWQYSGALPVSREDYEAHGAFQASFSLRPLSGEEMPPYQHYSLSADGLIGSAVPAGVGEPEIPPFPLDGLEDFLKGRDMGPSPGGAGIPSAALAFALSLPALTRSFQGRRRKRKSVIYHDKRVAA